jgi:hypothetical protein
MAINVKINGYVSMAAFKANVNSIQMFTSTHIFLHYLCDVTWNVKNSIAFFVCVFERTKKLLLTFVLMIFMFFEQTKVKLLYCILLTFNFLFFASKYSSLLIFFAMLQCHPQQFCVIFEQIKRERGQNMKGNFVKLRDKFIVVVIYWYWD